MTCDKCRHWNLRSSAMARMGFGNCNTVQTKAYFTSPRGGCEKFAAADSVTVEARQKFLEKKR